MSDSKPSGGLLGDRSVAFWTMIAGIAAVLGLVITLTQLSRGTGTTSGLPSRTYHPRASVGPREPTPGHSATPTPSQDVHYEQVPLGVLCNSNNVTTNFNFESNCQVDSGTVQLGSQVFTYAADAVVNIQSRPVMSFPNTTCRRLKLQFGFNNEDGPMAGLTMTVSVVQSPPLGPKQATVAINQLGKLSVKLDGGPWDIDTVSNIPVGGNWDIYMNGSASCSTNNGE
jgi:hypothetical protein